MKQPQPLAFGTISPRCAIDDAVKKVEKLDWMALHGS